MDKIQNYINHVVFVVDASGSMSSLTDTVAKVFDGQIARLATRSKELHQETRVSVYIFGDTARCIIYDMDVMRLPSLVGHNRDGGMTALIDASVLAIDDLMLTPQKYADHAFLVYVLTDGAENQSRNTPRALKERFAKLSENWTFACLVPDERSRNQALLVGFPQANTEIWSTTVAGVEQVGEKMNVATDNFMQARAKGVRSTTNLFQLDASALTKTAVKQNLVELKVGQEYDIFPVHKDAVIQSFVESWTKTPYRKGSAYYFLEKQEKIQNYKQICIQEKTTGKVYSGVNARQLLGLPDCEVKVAPASHPNWNLFVQSTSLNRKLRAGTELIVLK